MLNENSKFTLTLGRLIFFALAIVGTGFTFGMSYQSLLPDRQLQQEQKEEIQDIKITLAKTVAILETMKEQQDQARRDLSAVQTNAHKMNAEIQLISSYVQNNNRTK